jgi:hypothetical protein
MKSKELVELQKIERKVMNKLNTHKKVEKKLFDTYLEKLDKWVDSESEVKQNGKSRLEATSLKGKSRLEETSLKGKSRLEATSLKGG